MIISYLKVCLTEYLDIFDKNSALVFVNLNRVATLVKSFKQVAVDQSHNEIRKMNLNENVQGVINSIMPNYKGHNIEINVDINSDIICEIYPGALVQIITNLIINAFVHAFNQIDDGKITINAKQKEELIELTIKDNGNGMSEQVRQKNI